MMFIGVSSHRRSGTHLLIDIVRQFFDVDVNFYHLEELNDDFLSLGRPVILKSHEVRRFQKMDNRAIACNLSSMLLSAVRESTRQIYVVRNPVCVLESLFYFDIAAIEPVYAIDKNTTFTEFLLQEGVQDAAPGENRIQFWMRCIGNWLQEQDVLLLRYEDVVQSRDEAVRKLSLHLELPISTARNVDSTAIGKDVSFHLRRSNIWSHEARELFRAFKNEEVLAACGYRDPFAGIY